MGMIRININDIEIKADDDKNILSIALENNIEIPHLCFDERVKPYGACGLCVIEVEGNFKLQRACSTKPLDGMIIKTNTQRLINTRKAALKLLCSDHRGDCRPPCMIACPGKTDCQGYVGLIANGEYKEALKLTKENIPLPASIGRVCPHPCETACRRELVEEPVSIAALKSFVADMDLDKDTYIPQVNPSTGKKVAVIGAGPAGISCAYYLAKKGHKVDIYEAMPKPGGMLRYGIPQYRLPKEVLDREIEIINKMGVNIIYNTKIGIDISIDYLRKQYDSIFIGIGAWESSKLGCIGEDSKGVIGGIDFLISVASNEQVSIGKKVIVVGGGNTAMDVCRTAVRLGAEEVKVIYRRTREEMPAEKIEVDDAEEEGVKFEFLVAPIEVINKEGKAIGIECQKMMLVEADESGRRKPIPIEGEKVFFQADMIISAIGQKINSKGLMGIRTSKSGSIIIDEDTYMTSIKGVFAGGDAVTGPYIAIAAIGHGRICADLIDSYLNGVIKKSIEPLYVKQLDISEKDFEDKIKYKRVCTKSILPEIRKHNFAEINSILTEEEAKKESLRCLECGCMDYFECQLYKYINEYGVDPNDFKGERPKHKVINEHSFIVRNQDKCVLCGLCIRACDEIMGINTLGLVNRGFDSTVKPEFGLRLEDSSCISCGECTNVCPTGACTEVVSVNKQVPVNYESYEGICGYCSIGCKLRYDVKGDKVFRAFPLKNEESILCLKGKFGLNYINSKNRATETILKGSINKALSNDEAKLYFVKKLQAVNATYGKDSIAFAVSPRFSNEEFFVIKKIANKFNTSIIGSFTNFDRPNLYDVIGFDGSTNSYEELLSAEVILSFGSIFENHPVLGVKIKNAALKNSKLVSINNQKTMAEEWAQISFKAENNLIFIQKFVKALISLNYINKNNIHENIHNSDEFINFISEAQEDDAAMKLARLYGSAVKPIILIDEDTISSEAIELLCVAARLCGKLGLPHRGIIIARRKNNSQGLLDMGFTYTGSSIIHKIEEGKVKALVVLGEDPLGSDDKLSELFKKLDSLITFDIFNTNTVSNSDLFIPVSSSLEDVGSYTRSDRKVQFSYESIGNRKGKSTFEILSALLRQLGTEVNFIKEIVKMISFEVRGYEDMLTAFESKKDFYTFGKNCLDSSVLAKLDENIFYKIPDNRILFVEEKVYDTIDLYWNTCRKGD